MPRPLKRGILGASTIILSKDIDKYAFMCSSNFNETDVSSKTSQKGFSASKCDVGIFKILGIFCIFLEMFWEIF